MESKFQVIMHGKLKNLEKIHLEVGLLTYKWIASLLTD